MLGYNYNPELDLYNVPLEDYLFQIEKLDVKDKIDYSIRDEIYLDELYEIEDRMKYGMPITRQDFIKVEKKILTRSTN